MIIINNVINLHEPTQICMTSVLWHWRISLICRFLLHRVIAVYRSSSESSWDVLRWYMLSQLLQMTNTHRRLVLIYICMILPTQNTPPSSWVGGRRDIWGPLGGSTDSSGRGMRLLYISVNKILLHQGFCTSKCLLSFFSQSALNRFPQFWWKCLVTISYWFHGPQK